MENYTDYLLTPLYYLLKWTLAVFNWWGKIYWGDVEPTFWNYVIANAFSFGGAIFIFTTMKAVMRFYRKFKSQNLETPIFDAIAYTISGSFWMFFTPGMGVFLIAGAIFVILHVISSFNPKLKQ